MPHARFPYALARDPRWYELAGGKRTLRDELQAGYFRLLGEGARRCGYLTRDQALRCLDGRVALLDLLTAPMLDARPFLHTPGHRCDGHYCIDRSRPWVSGYDYRICGDGR